MRLEPASGRTHAELAAIFTAGYEGYFTPVVVDEAAFRFMVETSDVDLDASRVAVLDDEPVGICTLAVRGKQGWIGGLGVMPPHRSKGVGAVLMRRVIEEEGIILTTWRELMERRQRTRSTAAPTGR